MPDPSAPTDVMTELATVGAIARAAWRAEEMMWSREAARRWAHGRRIADVLREYAARGDRVAVDVAGCTFDGAVRAVGDDRVDLVTVAGVVTIRTALADGFGALPAPVVYRRSHRARAGGRRVPSALVTFTARLRELEADERRVRLATFVPALELTGTIVVGADHVVVAGDDHGHEVVVPLAAVAYVVEAPEARA